MKKEKKILDPSFCFRSWIERKPVYQENRDNKEIAETPDYKPKVSIIDKVKEKIGKLRKK